ncbi:hypothetical protein [Amycolatopsis magusensis]|uniref:hypothetical protein n=1 Tax=Amycolatopsis magusensis TaxID=882444 RepID=UPI0037889E88
MSNWAQERRANRAAEAEQKRADADAASARRIAERDALAEQNRRDAAARAELERAEQAAEVERRQAVKAERIARRAARSAALRSWAAAHTVDLLIYPLAIASALMAIPSMAAFGISTYGNVTGIVLPILSELGMWAFAMATTASRRSHPDRPVWALQTGVWLFAAVAFGLNVLHGLDKGLSAGVVMGVCSVAGVLAHQLVTASPRRSPAERHAARVARRELRKVAKVRRAAVAQAVAEIDEQGTARLVYTPGRYFLGKRGQLTEAIEQATPIEPVHPMADTLADEIAAWLAIQDRPSNPDADQAEDTGTVAVLDPPAEQRESRPKKIRVPRRQTRTMADLRNEFRDALATGSIDPTSAESIRKTLRCSPARARELRDEHKAEGGQR